MLMHIKDRLYELLVRRQPCIQQRYESYVNDEKIKGTRSILKSWMLLIKLNFAYYFGKLLGGKLHSIYFQEILPMPSAQSESSLSVRESPQEFADRLMKYDVISFDIFDTLIFRPFGSPHDVFYLVGAEHKYLDFANLRVQAEAKMRERKRRIDSTDEINLDEIYKYIEENVGMSAQEGKNTECTVENMLCYANPYMLEVYTRLYDAGKCVICMSDMYLSSGMLKKILEMSGYKPPKHIFVSCECRVSKYTGKMYDMVKRDLGAKLNYAHVGDNYESDVKAAELSGITAFHYTNVNYIGNLRRPVNMSPIIGGAYRGIVNSHLHNGLHKYSQAYEYGFLCGGLFVLGYCRFIHEYTAKNKIQRILFLARDGEILKKVYDELYPDSDTKYVYWSRLVAAKLSAEHYKYDYLRRFIWHKVDTGITVGKALEAMELNILLSNKRLSIPLSSKLSSNNAKVLITWLRKNWDDVLNCYKNEDKAAKAYISQIVVGCKKACAVDIGWAGSGANILDYLVNKKWGLSCEITGIVAGTNTAHNYEPHTSEALLISDAMVSYTYSQQFNRDLWCRHNPSRNHNVYLELLLSSQTSSLTGFVLDNDDEYRLVFSDNEEDTSDLVCDIQMGIIDFVRAYCKHFDGFSYMFNISGADVYAPFAVLADQDAYFKSMMKNVKFKVGVG